MTATDERASPSEPRRSRGSGSLARQEPAPGGWGLGSRVFATQAAFLALTLALVLAFASWESGRRAERRIREAMAPVPRILHGYVESLARRHRDEARTLAESVSLKALLGLAGTDAAATFHDSAVDLAGRSGASTVFLFDPRGGLLARSDRGPGEEFGRDFSRVAWVGGPLGDGESASAFILEVTRKQTLSIVAAAPVYQGEGAEQRVNGVVALAFELGEPEAREVAELVSGESALVANVARRGQPADPRVLVATGELRLLDLPAIADESQQAALFGRGEDLPPFDFATASERYSGAAIAFATGGGEPIGALVAARPKSAELAAFRALRGSVLAVGLLALAVSLPISFALARRTSRPIEQLATAADALRQGQLDVELPRARDAEVSSLTRAFGALISELREKRALERLLTQVRRQESGEIRLDSIAPGESAAERLRAGQLVAHRYRILSLLGGGGMGRVFHARDEELDEDVAIKVLNPRMFEQHDRVLQGLRQEIKVARAVTHVNVVRVHDLGEAEGLRFLTMEYVPGTTLRRVLSQRARLDVAPGMQIAKQLCRGLAAVHGAGIVHGDIKPENLMVLANGLVKLMDFGLARRAGLHGLEAGWTAGTPAYMSPESARGAELDERSDLYAVGVLMYETFTGRLPFDDDDYREIMRQHLYTPPADPAELAADLPEPLTEVILACLAKNRLERPASAVELERALMRVRT